MKLIFSKWYDAYLIKSFRPNITKLASFFGYFILLDSRKLRKIIKNLQK